MQTTQAWLGETMEDKGTARTRTGEWVMKIMVFTEGTIIMHESAAGHSREEIVRQVTEKDPSVKQYSDYMPIGQAQQKLSQWAEQGATIVYITSRKGNEVDHIRHILKRHGFLEGQLEFRRENEEYKDVVERVKPDILVEDDCESIGGESEMIYSSLGPQLRQTVKSIIAKEFEGIDHFPDDPTQL